MFCPRCRCEYRPGFSRCADCDVELVEVLSEAPPEPPPETVTSPQPPKGPMLEYCGFFSLGDAQEARSRLKREGIPAEILIRDAEDPEAGEDEYWLRVGTTDFPRAGQVLGYDESEQR